MLPRDVVILGRPRFVIKSYSGPVHAALPFALLRLIFKQGRVAGWMHLELDASHLYVVYGNGSEGACTALGPPALA